MTPVAVFDCMIFLQALASEKGPAFRCFAEVERGSVTLALSTGVIDEVREVLGRFDIQRKFPSLVPQRVEMFLKGVIGKSKFVSEVRPVFQLPRDPKDAPYVDLAIAASANYLVTWNTRHIGYLMKKDTPEGIEFCSRYPGITILEPPPFLRELDRTRA